LPAPVLYALLRAGLPSDKLLLAEVGADAAGRALAAAQQAGIVKLDPAVVRGFRERFEAFAAKVRFDVPAPGTQATYRELLATSGLSEAAQAAFTKVYLSHRGDAAELWERAKEAGLDTTQVARLKLHGKLAYLTGNSPQLTGQLRDGLDG